ncbi:hypothetical protein CQW23_10364 [Capsicum baccatum]|uniref:Uncharacterized protein n=1 Tax=Capsicum baccatum TaxID=33114 RepID=A0A2G2WZD8_CAPBA|nr:hypothetical protein CQW23_10364 [Capsicum baccatum]
MPSSAMWLEINFFQKNGFDNTQINNIVSKSPDVLFCKVDKTLQPKLVILQEIGLSSKDLYKFLMENYGFFRKDEKIRKFILQNPMRIRRNRGWIEDVIHRVEKDLGIPRDSEYLASRSVLILTRSLEKSDSKDIGS